jgi:hypothetical protein
MIHPLACALVCSALAIPASADVQDGAFQQDNDVRAGNRIDNIGGNELADRWPDLRDLPAPMGTQLNGAWQLAWDDQINGELTESGKTCTIDFQTVNQTITGTFQGPVMGTERNAVFTGEVFGGYPALLTFTQREPGYTCTYQIWWSPSESSTPLGAWHDTRGASGEFSLMKLQ